MTSPGARQAQQSYQQQVHHNSATFARNAAHQDQLRYRRAHPRGPVGVVRRVFGFVFSLVFIAIAVGVLLLILSTAAPEWLAHATVWIDQIV